MALFMLPFNGVMAGFWVAGMAWVMRRVRGSSTDSADVVAAAGLIQTSSPKKKYYYAIVSGAAGAVAAAFISILVVAFAFGFHPRVQVVLWAWKIVAIVAVAAFCVHIGVVWRGGDTGIKNRKEGGP